MKLELRTRDRRALIGLVAALAVFLVTSQFLLPVYDRLAAAADSAQTKEAQLLKYRRAVLRKVQYTRLLEQARKNVAEAEARLIRGDNPSMASVEFQSIVEEAAKKVEIDLNQRSIAPARKKDNFFNEITMGLTFECTPNQLARFLSELRSAPKFVTVRNGDVSPAQIVFEPPKKGEFQKRVRVNLTLAALLASAPQPEAAQKK